MVKKDDKEKNITVKNMSLTTAVLGFCLLISVFAPTIASADWGFNMSEYGTSPGNPPIVTNFAKIELFITGTNSNNPIYWSGNGAGNISNPNWHAQQINSTYMLLTGPTIQPGTPPSGGLSWDTIFTDPADGRKQSKSFNLDYLVVNAQNNAVYGVRWVIQNGRLKPGAGGIIGLDPSVFLGAQYNRTPAAVPVPPSIFLLGAGLIGVIVLRKRAHG
jgi:hypothetical protein